MGVTIGLLGSGAQGEAQDKAPGAPGGGLRLGGSHDATLPIEITANALEVSQSEQTAIFSGKVVATQGEMRLSADDLRVYYRTGGTARGGASGAISRLDAIGNVTVNARTESASGEWAVYDVNSGQITMGGNVSLQRGENIIRGEQLVIDLPSAQSRISGGPGSGNGRVKGVFVPAKKQPATPP